MKEHKIKMIIRRRGVTPIEFYAHCPNCHKKHPLKYKDGATTRIQCGKCGKAFSVDTMDIDDRDLPIEPSVLLERLHFHLTMATLEENPNMSIPDAVSKAASLLPESKLPPNPEMSQGDLEKRTREVDDLIRDLEL